MRNKQNQRRADHVEIMLVMLKMTAPEEKFYFFEALILGIFGAKIAESANTAHIHVV